jgi:hypothetical protein
MLFKFGTSPHRAPVSAARMELTTTEATNCALLRKLYVWMITNPALRPLCDRTFFFI